MIANLLANRPPSSTIPVPQSKPYGLCQINSHYLLLTSDPLPCTDVGRRSPTSEWYQLRRADPTLDVEKFARHVLAANKTGFLSPESLAAIANALLTSTLEGAAYLGR